jgi:PhnB protein
MKLNPYLNFNGQCKEAFELYAKVLGGKIEMMMTFGDSPAAEHSEPGMHDRIMHARLVAGDAVLLASDAPPQYYEKPQGTSVSVHVGSPEEAERVFHGLAEGGQVTMPIQETFWSPRFGMLVDRFGIPWFVNCEPAS